MVRAAQKGFFVRGCLMSECFVASSAVSFETAVWYPAAVSEKERAMGLPVKAG